VDAFPRLPEGLERRIFYDTAAELYGFGPRAAAAGRTEAAASGGA
jgi:hypothetical protein